MLLCCLINPLKDHFFVEKTEKSNQTNKRTHPSPAAIGEKSTQSHCKHNYHTTSPTVLGSARSTVHYSEDRNKKYDTSTIIRSAIFFSFLVKLKRPTTINQPTAYYSSSRYKQNVFKL